ncbi:DUF4097 domain-containing protein [Streptomyces sp. ST2-7A]|uniref:DUF4097 family beta strand repeat-containing protein n=1 Tax=Streptomyces sp. ST2-7A TaxID=2907214 RepID=UPI001F32E647|nr:DUF4097 domain-containing protein [Streptomyces sp. ST2-7A]MCE7082754.1 DUF4097 domain-containing protein [Streptomyces sp. ST2-7A]
MTGDTGEEWANGRLVEEPATFDLDGPVEEVQLRLVNGAVNIVGAGGADGVPGSSGAALEISEVRGAPLRVTREGTRLVIGYDDVPWQGFLRFFDRGVPERRAVVSLSVPATARLNIGVVGAPAVISGLAGDTCVRSVSGDVTLIGLAGAVRAETVSGSLEAESLTGDLRFTTVSGDLTLVGHEGASVRADSVAGGVLLDLAPVPGPREVRLQSVSGELAVRLPDQPGAVVGAHTAAGSLSSEFEALTAENQWGSRRLTGTLGAGAGSVRLSTVSGAITLLRRPAGPEETETAGTLRKDV